jgi:hypothetical protein
METPENECPRGIQWGINKQLIDIDNTDDTHTHTHIYI